MIRRQRAAHLFVWSALAILIALVLVGALVARERAFDAARAITKAQP